MTTPKTLSKNEPMAKINTEPPIDPAVIIADLIDSMIPIPHGTEPFPVNDPYEWDLGQSPPFCCWKNCRIGKFLVTEVQWEAVMGKKPANSNGRDWPVTVSWHECLDFLNELNDLSAVKKSRLLFSIPTKEDWMFACRAGATGDYCKLADGTEITKDSLGEIAWFKDNSDGKVHPVGEKKPNAFGLYDMLGNVSEWTSTEPFDEEDHEDCALRVLCGGDWYDEAQGCETAHRSYDDLRQPHGIRLCAFGQYDEKELVASWEKISKKRRKP